MDPDCENKKAGNLIFYNKSEFILKITVRKGESEEDRYSRPEYQVTVNPFENNILMGIAYGSYSYVAYYYFQTGGSTSKESYNGTVQVFKCKETRVNIK